MGFAGQVFAARVAIGLAVPSPQAISKTGGMLAKGITEISRQIELAKNRHNFEGRDKDRFMKNRNTMLSSTEKMNREIVLRMNRTLKGMNVATKEGIQESAMALKSNYAGLQQALEPKLYKKLTAGMSDVGSNLANVQAGTKNLHEMNQQERSAVINTLTTMNQAEDRRLQKEQLFLNNKKKIKDLSEQEVEDRMELLRTDQEQLLVSNELVQDFRDKIALSNQLTSEYTFMSAETSEIAENMIGATNVIRTKFNTALRDTVSILTAIGYKLNQTSQELIEFERELLNANSVFGLTNDKLFEVGNTIIEFGNQFGIATMNGAAGLYQLASAGLTAAEAMEVLPHTLKLSMAVQGDHNTISKLTAQTIFGFGMEMEEAAIVTDKFAYAIQKSLIEYQDLSSAVKFALPFFTSTGQTLDQLLGALQILTNRALEAGIAGRGLRQALAEFAEGAMDAEAGFRKMGVEILNAEGEMMQLTEIASQFAKAVGPETMSNTELLTTLIEDLNVRGATAFIHLVQASDEFTEAVEATTNAGGQLDQMVRIQNEALSAQLQILKTNIFSIFALRDASYEGTEYINAFHEAVVQSVEGFTGLIIETKNGKQSLTEFGKEIQTLSIAMVKGIVNVIMDLIRSIKTILPTLQTLWGVILVPLKIIAGILNSDSALVQGLVKFVLYWKALTMLGIPTLLMQMTSLLRGMGLLGSGSMAARAHAGGMGMMFGVPGTAATKGLSYNAFRTSMAGKGMSRKAVLAAYHAQKGGTAAGMATKGLFGGPMGKMLGRGLGFAIPGLGAVMMAATAYQLYKAAGIDMGAEGGLLQAGGYVHGLQGGGSAMGGRPYLVGEQGPELFVPGASGQVLNNSQTQNMLGGNVILRDVTIGVDSFGGLA